VQRSEKLLRLVDRLLMSLPADAMTTSLAQRIPSAVRQFEKRLITTS
jgi:hypothetical protein